MTSFDFKCDDYYELDCIVYRPTMDYYRVNRYSNNLNKIADELIKTISMAKYSDFICSYTITKHTDNILLLIDNGTINK